MRSTKYLGGLGALALLLAGCSNEDVESTATSPADPPTAVDHCTDPLAGNPTDVNAQELAFCQAEGLTKIAGWIQEDAIDGTLASRSRVNIDPLAAEIQSYTMSGVPGPRAILIRGNTFVERDGQWVQATTDSNDETLAYQATMPMRFEALLNPKLRAAGTNPDLTYSVIARETLNGEDVTVLSMQLSTDAETNDTRESRLYVRDDYVVVHSESTFRINGSNQIRTTVLTTIDEPQEIINPRFENDDESGLSSKSEQAGE